MTDDATASPHRGRADLLDELAALRENGKTPRIDNLRNRLDSTRELLAIVAEETDDLHVLAYNRAAAQREAVVAGGQPDYALDTHGDQRARRAYRGLGLAAIDAVEILAAASHNAFRLLRTGSEDRPRIGRRMIEIEELAAGIEAQARRVIRGEYAPVRREPQPEAEQAHTVVDRLRRERDQARTEVQRLTITIERLNADLQERPHTHRGRPRLESR